MARIDEVMRQCTRATADLMHEAAPATNAVEQREDSRRGVGSMPTEAAVMHRRQVRAVIVVAHPPILSDAVARLPHLPQTTIGSRLRARRAPTWARRLVTPGVGHALPRAIWPT